MSIKRTILLATASIAIGFAFTPAHAQTANEPGSSAAPRPAGDDGVGLPLPTPPAWLTQPRPKQQSTNDCDSIRQRIAQLQADITSYQSAAAKALAESQQEAKEAAAAKDTWQKEETLWKSSSQAAQNTSNPGDKKLLQQAASQHWWKAEMAKSSYESLQQRSVRDSNDSSFFLRMVTYAQREIDELKAKEQAACAEKKVAGGNNGTGYVPGVGPNVPLGGSSNSGGVGPNAPLGGSDSHGKINLPLGEDPNKSNTTPPAKSTGNVDKKPDAPSTPPVMKQETQKKVSALPNGTVGPAAPLADQPQDASAPNLRAYFASRAQIAGGSIPANRATVQNTALKISVPGAPVVPAPNTVTLPSSQITATPTMPMMPARAEQPYGPAAMQSVPQNPAIAMQTSINRETVPSVRTPVNGAAVSNISTRIGPITVIGH
jgi:hypothetical protein